MKLCIYDEIFTLESTFDQRGAWPVSVFAYVYVNIEVKQQKSVFARKLNWCEVPSHRIHVFDLDRYHLTV